MKTLTKASVVSLREVTKDTVRAVCLLKPSPHQEQFVASNAISIAQAHFNPQAWFRAVYADDEPVGFVMMEDWFQVPGAEPELYRGETYVSLWRFMIDARYQKLGFGAQAMRLAIAHARSRNVPQMLLSFVPAEGSPEAFYRSFGFAPNGDVDGGEVVMKLALT